MRSTVIFLSSLGIARTHASAQASSEDASARGRVKY